jgi:hypothetical protein
VNNFSVANLYQKVISLKGKTVNYVNGKRY